MNNIVSEETNPKFPMRTNRDKMKFNWRANWEILLVIVIIVVGIVITTIATIRSKDKHLLVIPEETDYGSLLAGGGGSPDQVAQVPPLQQTDFQLQNAQVLTSLDYDNPTTADSIRRPPRAKVTRKPVIPSTVDQSNSTQPTISIQQSKQIVLPNTNNKSPQQHLYHHNSHSKQDLNSGDLVLDYHNRNNNNNVLPDDKANHQSNSQTMSTVHDNYEAMSTESTPSQTRNDLGPTRPEEFTRSGGKKVRKNLTKPQQVSATVATDQLDDQMGILDDAHTTKSSLAGAGNEQNIDFTHQSSEKSNPSTLDQQHSTTPSIPSIAMHGPYGLASLSNLNNNQLQMILDQHQQFIETNRMEPPPSSVSSTETDDMMTSYAKGPIGGGAGGNTSKTFTDSLMRDYNLATVLNGGSNNNITTSEDNFYSDERLNPGSHYQQQQHITKLKSHTATLPFSILLNDLIKSTRTMAPTKINMSQQFEQPANSRPAQNSILQQLRSLPAPLLSLLHGSNSPPPGNVHELGSMGSPSNHDASESSPRYQRISMAPTSLQTILERSLRSSSVLPAFPPPKDAPQPWIPPTSGGNPSIHNEMNGNADFVASNTAGFIGPKAHQQMTDRNQHSAQSESGTHHYNSIQETIGQQQPQHSQQLQQQQQHQTYYPTMSDQQAQRFLVNNQLFSQHTDNSRLQHDYQQQQQQHQQQQHLNQAQNMHQQTMSSQMNQQQSLVRGPSSTINQLGPTFNTHMPVSEMPVPLGYNLSPQSQSAQQMAVQQQQQFFAQNNHQQQQHLLRRPFDFALSAETAPKATITNSVVISQKQQPTIGPPSGSKSASQTPQQQQQQIQTQTGTLSRQRRDTIEASASRDNPSEEEEYLDSRPISIVYPDGRPMSGDSARLGGARAGSRLSSSGRETNEGDEFHVDSASSPRKVKHLDYAALNHYSKVQNDGDSYHGAVKSHQGKRNKSKSSKQLAKLNDDHYGEPKRQKLPAGERNKKTKRRRSRKKLQLPLDTAGSRLMSKLLGTASTNDELEEDIDGDDEDSANEKRKEELEDAEFGLVNEERNNHHQQPDGPSHGSNSVADLGPSPGPISKESHGRFRDSHSNDVINNDSSLGSGSTDNEAYTKRQQQQQQHHQRSDIEFYGHPGEETRQLKYGILGSGNYEVVNGGIYPDADESTAAVNSVANYVRKPGLLALGGPQAALMPGGRLGGFMRGASANPNDLMGLVAPHVDHLSSAGKSAISSPLFDLIDTNAGHLFDPSLVGQLGSSGTSARTTHASQDDHDGRHQNNSNDESKYKKGKEQHIMAHSSQLEDGDTSSDDSDKSRFNSADKNGLSEFGDNNHAEQDTKSSSIDGNLQAYDNNHNQDDMVDNDRDVNDATAASQSDQKSSAAARDRQRFHSSANPQTRFQSASSSSSSSQGTNQFNSYQILPSKKVTIFSDQDLDSAPSEQLMQHHWTPQPPLLPPHAAAAIATREILVRA